MEKEIKREFVALNKIVSVNQMLLENIKKGINDSATVINAHAQIIEVLQITLGVMSEKDVYDVKDVAAKIAEIDAINKGKRDED